MPKKKSNKTDRSAPPNLKTDNPKIIETIEEKKIRWSNFFNKKLSVEYTEQDCEDTFFIVPNQIFENRKMKIIELLSDNTDEIAVLMAICSKKLIADYTAGKLETNLFSIDDITLLVYGNKSQRSELNGYKKETLQAIENLNNLEFIKIDFLSSLGLYKATIDFKNDDEKVSFTKIWYNDFFKIMNLTNHKSKRISLLLVYLAIAYRIFETDNSNYRATDSLGSIANAMNLSSTTVSNRLRELENENILISVSVVCPSDKYIEQRCTSLFRHRNKFVDRLKESLSRKEFIDVVRPRPQPEYVSKINDDLFPDTIEELISSLAA